MSAAAPAGAARAGAAPDGAVRAVVALGANLGDREQTLRDAVRDLAAIDGVDIVAASTPVESVAVTLHGVDPSKPGYVNGAVLVSTTLSPLALLDELNRIENDHGRVRLERWGDRTLDLDLIVHGDTVADSERLTLPHPRAAVRSFVLAPWLEIDPDGVVPGAGPIAALLERTQDPVSPVPGAARLDAAPHTPTPAPDAPARALHTTAPDLGAPA